MAQKRYLKIILISIVSTIIVLILAFLVLMYSMKTTYHFYINETGEGLNGDLYQDSVFIGEVEDGYINIVFQTVYTGSLRLEIPIENGTADFYFDLSDDAINSKEWNFWIFSNDLSEAKVTSGGYPVSRESEGIFNGLNKERADKGIPPLKKDKRLENIAGEFALGLLNGSIDGDNLKTDSVSEKMIESKIFFYDQTFYWYNYTVDLSDSLSELYLGDLKADTAWLKYITSPYTTNFGVSIVCSETEKKCIAFGLFSQNALFFEDKLPMGYVTSVDIYTQLNWIWARNRSDSNVSISFSSTKPTDVYLVVSPSDYENIRLGTSAKEVFRMTSAAFNRDVLVKPNNTIVLRTKYEDIRYSLNITELA